MGAIELVDDRYEDYSVLSAPVLIGDDFFNAGVVLGAEQTDWRDLDLKAVRGTLWIDGEERASGLGADILGDPLEALAWLANHRAGMGRPLRAGTFVMLGSVVQTVFFGYAGIGHGGLDRSQSGQSAVHLKARSLAGTYRRTHPAARRRHAST